jgi:hypothetical protein
LAGRECFQNVLEKWHALMIKVDFIKSVIETCSRLLYYRIEKPPTFT